MSDTNLKQLFDNESDCYTIFSAEKGKTEEATAMSKDKFVEVVSNLLQANGANKQPDTKALALNSVSGMLLSDYAQKKLEYINGSCIARDFPKEQPTKEWVGAVLDLLEDMKLGNYR